MADTNGYHEPVNELDSETRDIHRMIQSTIEELEAVDWYNQRAAVCSDEEQKKILEHNRDEEIEHMAMCLEWLRRKMPKVNEELETYLFTEGSIVEIEDGEEGGSDSPRSEESLGIGSLKKGVQDNG